MIKLIDLTAYKIVENENKKTKSYTILYFGREYKKTKTIEEAMQYIYEQEMKFVNNDPYKEVSWNDKTD